MGTNLTKDEIKKVFDELIHICKFPLKLIFKEGDNCLGFISYENNSITLHWNKINKLSEGEIRYIILHELGHEQHKREILEKARILGFEISEEVEEFKERVMKKIMEHAEFMELESEDFADEYARKMFR